MEYSRIFFNLAFFLPLFLSHQAFASSSDPFLPREDAALAEVGMCSLAVNIHGYKCQEYQVTTADGYILSLQRIPEGRRKGGGGKQKRPPVLLQHGVLVDGMTWVMNGPEQSLGLILADNGFDVWISNTRGTRFSRRHLHLDPSKPEYWNWTWDDLVINDLQSVIDLVFNQTGQKIHYVGHSMGTLVALASFSEGKQIDKVKSAALLSPIAYLSHMTTALGVLTARGFLGEITTFFGLAEFNPVGEAVRNFMKMLCIGHGVNCYDFISGFTGKNCCLNGTTVDQLIKNMPQSTSTKNMVHMAQTVRDGRLAKYDFGSAKLNMDHYGQEKPPLYDLTKFPHDLPLFISHGGSDALSDVKDVATLLDALKLHDVNKLHVQYVENYAHVDFILGVTAKDVIYNQIVAFFRNLH